jgi:hypothetical protein
VLLRCAHRHQEEYSAVTEPQRLALHAAARATLGEEEGDTLMALSPPANTDIATRQDVQSSEARVDARITISETRLDARMTAIEQRTRAYVWKVMVGTGVVLFLTTVGTMVAGVAVLVQVLERT